MPAELLTVSDPVTVLSVVELTKLSAPTFVPSALIKARAASAVPSYIKLVLSIMLIPFLTLPVIPAIVYPIAGVNSTSVSYTHLTLPTILLV